MFNPKYTASETANKNMILVKAKGFLGESEMLIPLTPAEFKEGMQKCADGQMIQNVFPKLSSTQREFLISGLDEKQQKEIFS
jgi:hypothetical protein